MSKDKAREFLARLKALEDEMGVSLLRNRFDQLDMSFEVGDDIYLVDANHHPLFLHHKFSGDVNYSTSLSTDPLSCTVVTLPCPVLEHHDTPFLKMDADRKQGTLANITDE